METMQKQFAEIQRNLQEQLEQMKQTQTVQPTPYPDYYNKVSMSQIPSQQQQHSCTATTTTATIIHQQSYSNNHNQQQQQQRQQELPPNVQQLQLQPQGQPAQPLLQQQQQQDQYFWNQLPDATAAPMEING